nr:DUF3299 domain-containing protein [uncultured Roseibium sp.]
MFRIAVFALSCFTAALLSAPGIAVETGSLRERAATPQAAAGSLPFARSMATAAPAVPAGATDGNTLAWTDLRPVAKSLEAPFASLPEPLLEAMRTHVQWRTSKRSARSDEAFIAEHNAAITLLEAHEIDVEGLMRERRKIIARNGRIARGANPDILGATIRLPGYVVPLAFNDQAVTEFLFVPVAGACVHTPTPAPNQIVHVRYPKGIAFSSIFDAFWIEGELTAEESKSDILFYDGAATGVQASYALNATDVRSFQ